MNEDQKSAALPANEEKLDPVAISILTSLNDAGPGKAISPEKAARAYAETRSRNSDPPDIWRRYLNVVRQQAKHWRVWAASIYCVKENPSTPTISKVFIVCV